MSAASGYSFAVGDWVNVSEAPRSEQVAVVIQLRATDHGPYYKVVPIHRGYGRPFWVSATRCRLVPPSQQKWSDVATRHILRGGASVSSKRTEDTQRFPFMETPGAHYFPDDQNNPFLASGDWVIFLDQENEECVGVVVDRNVTSHGVYLKVVPVGSSNRRPFWAPAHRCSPIPPSGDGGL